MAIYYDDWEPDYSESKYVDNCICDIPLYDKNDTYDKVGIHNFRIYNSYSGDTDPNATDEDVHMLPKYYAELVRASGTTTNTTARNQITTLINYCLGTAKIDNGYCKFYNGTGPASGFCYDGEGGFRVPSLNDSSNSFSHLGSTTDIYKNSDYKYYFTKGTSASNSSTVRTRLEPNPFKVNNPKTGIPYDTLCIKMEIWYRNAHYYLANHESSTFVMSNSDGKRGMVTRLYGEASTFIVHTTKNGATASYSVSADANGSDEVSSSGSGTYGWHTLTTIVKRENITGSGTSATGYGGYVKSYFDNKNSYAGFGLAKGAYKYLHGTSTATISADYYNPSFYPYFTVAAIHTGADTDRKSCNKNYIRKFQIFHGENYSYNLTEPVYKLKYSQDNKTERVVTNVNELKNKSIRCYEYR